MSYYDADSEIPRTSFSSLYCKYLLWPVIYYMAGHKEETNEVKSQSFVDIVKQEVEKMEGDVNVVKQTLTETRENAEEERDKEARRNNIIILSHVRECCSFC